MKSSLSKNSKSKKHKKQSYLKKRTMRLLPGINKNKKVPLRKSDNEDEKKISNWYASQQKNYNKKTEGMKNSERYDLWSKFLGNQ
jgi:hypothetical protein